MTVVQRLKAEFPPGSLVKINAESWQAYVIGARSPYWPVQGESLLVIKPYVRYPRIDGRRRCFTCGMLVMSPTRGRCILVTEWMSQLFKGEIDAPYDVVFEVVRPDGQEKLFHAEGRFGKVV